MTCEECKTEAEGRAEGWEAHLVDTNDDGEEVAIFFCALCAEREFHAVE